MTVTKKGSAGGKVTAKILRNAALERYYNNPQICLFCNRTIQVGENQRIPDVRKKKFCTRSCSGSFFGQKKKINRKNNSNRKKFKNKRNLLANKTKGEVFTNNKNYASARAVITKHARYLFKKYHKNPKCIKCGYERHVETAHKKSVMSFPDTALIEEINSIDNLIGLCPTHHWEFDNGFLRF